MLTVFAGVQDLEEEVRLNGRGRGFSLLNPERVAHTRYLIASHSCTTQSSPTRSPGLHSPANGSPIANSEQSMPPVRNRPTAWLY
jgi:hypothetical protein